MNNIRALSAIPSIIKIEEICLDNKLLLKFNKELRKIAKENSKLIFVYRIAYRSQGHTVIGFIVEPRKGKNLPCIICNRGGSGNFGVIEEEHLFVHLIARLAANGYVCITTQYSGNAGSEGKDQHGGSEVEDVLTLYKILKKYKRADAKRTGMYGVSRGGMMTYIVLSKVKWLKAAVIHAGTADLISKKKFRPEMERIYKEAFGGSMAEKKKRSVLYWADKLSKKTPILIMHGTADWRVNPMDSLKLAEKLYEYKIPYRLMMFEGGDHGLSEYRRVVTQSALTWFERFVKNGEKLPNLEPHGE